ncbi:MAG: IS66 family transposase [Rikenellaceae bacterium]
MKDAGFDIEYALRRRLNWGRCGEINNQTVTESSIIDEVDSRFASLKKKISYRDKVITQSREIISEQKATIAAKDLTISTNIVRIKELEEEISRLKSIVSDSAPTPRLTSRNSSVPPSKNPLGTPQTRSLREKSGKKSGGQAGHVGATKEWNNSPDTIEEMQAPTICPSCGRNIEDLPQFEGERRQVVDIPSVVVPMVKEFVEMRRRCTCGKCAKGEFPKEASGTVCYGHNIEATVAYLSTLQSVPFARLTHLMEVLFGVKMSQGSVSNILKRMRKKAQLPYEMIRKAIEHAAVVGADESGAKIDGKNHWMWTFQTDVASYLAIDKSHGGKVVDSHFPDGFPEATLVSDRLALYFNVVAKDHQICLAHLLRNTIYIDELLGGHKWAKEMLELLRGSIHRRKTEGCSEELKAEYRERLDELLDREVVLKSKKRQGVFDKFREGLSKHRANIFTFLTREDVPSDNNASERSLRVVKTKLKVSGQFKSTEGAQQYATLQSIVQTARKCGGDPLVALLAVAVL